MLIVSAADERFAAHFATMLHSVWTQHPNAELCLLDCGIEPGTLADLKGFAIARGIVLAIIKIDITFLRHLPTTSQFSTACYARLLIPDLLPGSIERVLYLDSDCVVVDDLTPLWQIDMGEAAIAAVNDPIGARLEREIGIHIDEQDYINSGVLMMNLPVWRRDKLAASALAFLGTHQSCFADQAGINVACARRTTLLSAEWNFLLHVHQRPQQWLEPKIIHYSSAMKPWIHCDVPFAAIYLHHRNRTPFPIELPPPYRSKLRCALNLLVGRRKYWDRLKLVRRCDAFTAAYFGGLPRGAASS